MTKKQNTGLMMKAKSTGFNPPLRKEDSMKLAEKVLGKLEEQMSKSELWKLSPKERTEIFNNLPQKEKVKIENDHSDHKHAGSKAHPLCGRCPAVKPKK
jgi:hypothetical protein